jgi:hypothetical protein
LHSFAGVGLGKGTAQQLAGRVLGSKRLTQRWTNTKALIIDESVSQISHHMAWLTLHSMCIVSMLDAIFFDKLVRATSHLRFIFPEPKLGVHRRLRESF